MKSFASTPSNRTQGRQDKSLVKVENLSKTYLLDGLSVEALRGVNLNIEAGEFMAITGPSGCGKSTLMHLLGLLDSPTLGTIYFEGKDVSRLSDDRRASFRSQKIGFVFQNFNLLAKISALENVLLPTLYDLRASISKPRLKSRAKDLLSEVGLADRLEHKPNQLSGGQSQRVALARALMNDAQLILADEPTGNLDSKSGQEVLGLLKSLNEKGRTIVVVTHDANVAAYCQRIIKMKDGQIVDD